MTWKCEFLKQHKVVIGMGAIMKMLPGALGRARLHALVKAQTVIFRLPMARNV